MTAYPRIASSGTLGDAASTADMPRLLTAAEVGRRVNIAPKTVRRWAAARHNGFPAALRLSGARVVWREDELAAWIDRLSRDRR